MSKDKVTSIRLDPDLVHRLKVKAAQEKKSMKAVIEDLIKIYLDEKKH
jgi:predicted transcriptional regulator